MAIDPNIALGVQTPQFVNPLDAATKAQNLRGLIQTNDLADRQTQQQMALSDLIRKNTSVNANGTPSVNMNQFSSQALAPGSGVNPQAAMDYAKQLHNNDLDALTKNTQAAKTLSWSILPDGSNYQDIRQKASALGLPNADKIPQNYDPAFVQNWQQHTLSGDDQLKAQETNAKLAETHETHQARIQQMQDAADQRQGNKQNQALQQTQTMLESARGNPAAAQAEKDIYASQKVNSLINQVGDPNNMNMSMVHLLSSEVGKMASGGAPTVEELKGLTPASIPQGLSAIAEKFNNSPTAANAGAFVQQFQKYSDAIAGDARKVIQDKYGRVIETRRGSLSPANYQALQDNYVNRFNSNPAAGGAPAAHPQDTDAVSWAKANPSDPRAAKILQLNGGAQ